MIWLSERPRRKGFTILEAMIAMALLAIVLGTAMGGIGFTVGQVAERTEAAWATELARSVVDEFVVTRDVALMEGADGDLRWQLSEASVGGGLVEVTVNAWHRDGRARGVSLSVLVPEVLP
jgi:prepilin-type N-terminal cleavage/methylation domain-containing protein